MDKKYIRVLFFMFSVSLFGQVGIGTANPDTSAALHVEHTEKGILIPRMTVAQRDAIVTPATGLLIYQLDAAPGFYYYDGTEWVTFIAKEGWSLTGNTGTDDTVNKLGTTDAQDFIISTNNEEVVRIASNGNIGLNTPTPLAKLHIVQSIPSSVLLTEGFEDDTLAPFISGGDIGWTTTSAAGQSNSGVIGIKSGNIGDNQSSWIEYSATVPVSGGSISFAVKTSSEVENDLLTFEIDSEAVSSWDGDTEWKIVSYPLTGGVHTFRWTYAKNAFSSDFNDEVYIDDVLITVNEGKTLQIRDGNAGVDKVLTSDANGIATWQTPVPSSTSDADWAFHTGATNSDPIYHQGTVMIGHNAVSAYNLHVWDGVSSSGTTLGIGSIEYITDGEDELQFTDHFSPIIDDAYNVGSSNKRWTAIYASNGVVNTSDANLKTAIKPLVYGLEEVLQLKPISFKWKEEKVGEFLVPNAEKERKLGFIAQQVQKIIPEVVVDYEWKEFENNPGKLVNIKTKRLGMRYSELIPVAIKAIQEQQVKIEELKKQQQKLLVALEHLK